MVVCSRHVSILAPKKILSDSGARRDKTCQVGIEEAEAFYLLMEEDSLLCQLVGNPFVCQYMRGCLDYGNRLAS